MILVLCLVAAALVVGLRRRRTSRRRPAPRRWVALGVVAALLTAGAVVGSPALAAPFDCKSPPEPDRPATGLVGSLDPAPIGVGTPGSVYDEVGYAGQVWYTYDLGCGPDGVRDASATTDTWLGNQVFNVAKFLVGGVNWAHYLIQRGSDLLSPLDNVIRQGTSAMYHAVFTTWVGLVLLVLAVILLVLAARGDLARQALRTSVALAALAIAAAAYLAPLNWSKAADSLVLDGVTTMQDGFLSQLGTGDKDTLPTVLVDQVIYNNWLRGEFGSPDVPQAQQLGRDLLRAQTFTKREVAQGQDGPSQVQAKKDQFTAIAGKMGDRYPYFQGKSGSRLGAGVLALVQALCLALFQLLSKVLVLVAMLVIRLLVMTAPAVAVLALLKPEVLPAVLKLGGAAVVNALLVGGLAGLHALLVVSLFKPGSGVDTWLALLVTGVVTVILWAVARPFRRLVSIVTLTRDQVSGFLPQPGGGPMSGVMARLRAGRQDRQEQWWGERRSRFSDAGPGAGERAGERPETAPAAGRPVIRVDGRVVRAEPVTPALAGPPPGFAALGTGRAGRARARAEIATEAGPRALPAAGPARPAVDTGAPVRDDPRAVAAWVPESLPSAAAAAEEDRLIYRRPTSADRHRRAVEPDLAEGTPVYRIYRPSGQVVATNGVRPEWQTGGRGAD